jgi:peroxiredoxin
MPTTGLQLGDHVPAFALPDTDGAVHHVPLAEAPPATVLVVSCLHCPYVIAWNPRLRAVAEEYAPRGVRFLGIHANDATRYPADSLDHMKRFVREHAWPYPYLHDESQEVARALGAEVTPGSVPERGVAPARGRCGARRRCGRGARNAGARVQREVARLGQAKGPLRDKRQSVDAAEPGRLLRKRSRSSRAWVTGLASVAMARCWTPWISITGQPRACASAALCAYGALRSR